MVNPRESQTTEPWGEFSPEADWDEDMNVIDVFLDDEEFEAEENYDYDDADPSALASWRRIEIAKENRRLRSLLSDLDDYEDFEYPQDDYSAEYSY